MRAERIRGFNPWFDIASVEMRWCTRGETSIAASDDVSHRSTCVWAIVYRLSLTSIQFISVCSIQFNVANSIQFNGSIISLEVAVMLCCVVYSTHQMIEVWKQYILISHIIYY